VHAILHPLARVLTAIALSPHWGPVAIPKLEMVEGIGFTRPGKLSHNYGKSPCLMGKSTISIAIFNSYVKLPEGKPVGNCCCQYPHPL